MKSHDEQITYSEQGHLPELSKAGSLLAKLSERPEQSTALVHFLAVADRMNEVTELIKNLELRMARGEANIKQHLANTYNAAILASGVLGSTEEAERYYQRMKDHDVPRNEATYKALMNICTHQSFSEDEVERVRALAAEDGIYLV